MNFEFSEEQKLLRDQASRFLADNCPPSAVRAILEGDAAYDIALWRKVAEMGWPAACIPEQFGGLGLSYLELCVIAEEFGRVVAPIPFSSSVYLATEALLMAGSNEQKQTWLPKLASGQSIGTFALAERPGRPTVKGLAARASDRGVETKLTGNKIAVPDGDVADIAIVVVAADAANRGDGASWYLVDLNQPGVRRSTVKTIDPTRSHAQIELSGAPAQLLGEPGRGWGLTQRLLDRAAVLFAWEQVGGADAALAMAKEYALGRYAFGRPIASYQAIKHKLAHAYIKNTLARSNCYYGAWALNSEAAELALAAATARVGAIQAYHFASKENVQTHGGMGFTWEFDCQFHYRRAKLLSVNLGSEAFWQDRLIRAVEEKSAA